MNKAEARAAILLGKKAMVSREPAAVFTHLPDEGIALLVVVVEMYLDIADSEAHYFRKAAGDKARVLILENHDDFGGHAKRNEFRAGGRTILGFGGTYSIESPAPYSAVAKTLIEELGIDVPSYHKYVSKDLYRSLGLKPRIFFGQETFGTEKLVVNAVHTGEDESGLSDEDKLGLEEFLKEAPLSAKAKQDFQRLLTGDKDYFPGRSSDEKKARLARMSYAKYLTDTTGVSDEIVKLLQAFPDRKSTRL